MFKDSVSTTTPEQLQQRLTRPNKPTSNVANDDLDEVVENPVVEISRDVFRLESDIRKLTIRVDKRLLTKNIQDSLAHFRQNFDLYFESFKTPHNSDAIVSAGTNVATYGESVGHILNRFSSLGFENRRLAQQIIQRARSINNSLATKRDRFVLGLKNYKESDLPKVEKAEEPATQKEPKSGSQPFSAYAQNLARSRAAAQPKQKAAEPSSSTKPAFSTQSPAVQPKPAVDENSAALAEQLEKSKRHMQYFVANAKKAEAAYNARYNKIKELHEDAVEEISSSRHEIERLKSQVATSTVSRSFEQCAEEERSNADFYRYSAFAYLGVFFALAGYLFFDTTTAGFEWIKTAARSLLALTLLIPFGYVASESRNHRKQQHSYTKTAIELKTLAPHNANLPPVNLEKLKDKVLDGEGLKAKDIGRSYSDYYLMKNFDLLSELNRKLDKEDSAEAELKKAS